MAGAYPWFSPNYSQCLLVKFKWPVMFSIVVHDHCNVDYWHTHCSCSPCSSANSTAIIMPKYYTLKLLIFDSHVDPLGLKPNRPSRCRHDPLVCGLLARCAWIRTRASVTTSQRSLMPVKKACCWLPMGGKRMTSWWTFSTSLPPPPRFSNAQKVSHRHHHAFLKGTVVSPSIH